MNLLQEIRQGESQHREFKFRIDSQRKIAKTLVAFANSEGGRLFIGVKDNGVIAGVRGEEELYMLEGAADLHTRPAVRFSAEAHQVEGKIVLVVDIPRSSQKPHEAHEEVEDQRLSEFGLNSMGQVKVKHKVNIPTSHAEREWNAYFRQGAANFRANGVLIEYWKREKSSQELKEADRAVLKVLSESGEEGSSISRISKGSGLSTKEVGQILAALISWGLVSFKGTDQGIRFSLC
ncbi:MAG: putative DNA binding domain-containing protein [Schleiferiaceae bacterium]|nr:putative DNA binding domain-containing protein [Schleiferiaceae bacterium]